MEPTTPPLRVVGSTPKGRTLVAVAEVLDEQEARLTLPASDTWRADTVHAITERLFSDGLIVPPPVGRTTSLDEDLAELRSYAEKGPAVSRATCGRLADRLEAVTGLAVDLLTYWDLGYPPADDALAAGRAVLSGEQHARVPDGLSRSIDERWDRAVAAADPDLRTAAQAHLAAWDDEDHTVDALHATAEALRAALAAEATEPPPSVLARLVTYDAIEGPDQSVVPSIVVPHPTGTRVLVVVPASGSAPNPQGADEPTDDDLPMRPATLLMAIYFPDMPDGADPEQVADELVHILNEERIHNGASGDDLLSVSGIPPAQWATAQGLANLRASAAEGKELLAEVERLRAAAPASEDDEEPSVIGILTEMAQRAGSPPPIPAPTTASVLWEGETNGYPNGAGKRRSSFVHTAQLPVPPGTHVVVTQTP